MAAVNGERVKQAREIRALTQGELAERIGVSQPTISLIEQGAQQPSEGVLQALVLATGFPVGFFQKGKGPDFPSGSMLYRKSKKLPSTPASQLRQSARLALELVQALGTRFKPIPVRIPLVGSGDPIEAAHVGRSVLGASPDGPMTGVIRRLERAGVLVVFLPSAPDGFDGFSAWSDEGDGHERRPIICLKHGVPGDRLRLTAAEELGHLMMHQDFLGGLKELEQEADEFAGEFLFPQSEMKEQLRLPITLAHLGELKARWGVSIAAIAHLAEQRGLISDRQKRYVRAKLHDRGWLHTEPIHIPVEAPKLWRQMAEGIFGAPVDHKRLAREFEVSSGFVQQLIEVNRPLDARPIAPSSQVLLRFDRRRA
ncbi:MAG TPA: XRE family transcriptional regulator [Thermoanaerobaculia bacterium]|jgi:Zn-dependent peptidase ImmA (M78 family)/transcriptional regulator with XRE-family HTH domain|nr:XRE family transcriptional regulator [Thermoanaerobaculia bacterium]